MVDLKIIKAIYYAPEIGVEKGTDVSEELSAEVVGGRLFYNGTYNRIFTDNFHGIVKKLKIEIEYKGKKYTKYYNENEKINLPYDLGESPNSDSHVAFNVTKSSRNNIFVNSKVNDGRKISDKDNKFINTTIDNIKEHPLVAWLTILGIIFTIIWSIFIYIYPSKEILSNNLKTDQIESVFDLRGVLIEPIFDVASKIYQFKSDYDRNNFIDERKDRHFTGIGTISNFGQLSSGGIWATLKGNTTDGLLSSFECHFDDSWAKTIKNLVDTEKTNIKFSGEVGYYIQGVLVAKNCNIINIGG